jgi:hypothetical protein
MFDKTTLMVPAMMVMILLLAFAVSAQSDVPHQFYGSVTINGAPAGDGTMVIAKVGTTQVAATITSGGQYSVLVPDPYRNRDGDTIDFYVSNVKGGSGIFANGEITELSLAVTIAIPPPSGGGPSGGGPSGGAPPATGGDDDDPTGDCIENWECSDWLECYSGKQSRVCTDLNTCGTTDEKPSEEQECSVKVCTAGDQRCDGDDIVVCAQNEESWVLVKTCDDGCDSGLCSSDAVGITGFVGALPAVGGIIVIIIVAAGLVYWKKR